VTDATSARVTGAPGPDAQGPFQFQPGDVLLFNGQSWLSKAIRFFDSADVNHAALAVDGSTLIEAAGKGLRQGPIQDAVAGNNFTLVYRLPGQVDMGGVVSSGEAFLHQGTPYAYQQIVLLGLLSVSRRVDIKSRILRALVRTACDHAAKLINSLFERGDKLMICSEFVWRSYMDGHDARYALHLNDGWRQTFSLGVEDDDTTTVIEWARTQPEPPVPPEMPGVAEAAPGQSPEQIVAQAEAELEPLIAAYLVEQNVQDEEMDALMAVAAPVAEAAVPEVTDDELHLSAIALRDSLPLVRADEEGIQPAGIGDPWATVGDFVTPGDLEHATPIVRIRQLG
jgi:hypothetical protein